MVEDSQSGGCTAHSPQELAQFSDGTLSLRRQHRLQQHLQECPLCRRQLKELAAVRALLREAPAPSLPRSFALSPSAVRGFRHSLWYPRFRAVSAVVSILVLAVFLGSMLQPVAPVAAPATSRPLGQKPAPPVEPTPKSVAVAPAVTRRAPPTGSSHDALITSKPTATTSLSVSLETGYPAPPTPWIYTTVSHVSPEPAEQPQPTQPTKPGVWGALKIGGLLLLGLSLGLTWVAFRRERMFFL